AGPNALYRNWLWSSRDMRFINHAKLDEIVSPEFDPDTQEITSRWRASAAEGGVDIYVWESGDPVLIHRETDRYDGAGCTRFFYDRIGGRLEPTGEGPCAREISDRQMPCPRAPLDGGGGELVDVERFPEKLQQAHLLRADGKIGSGNFHRQRITRLAQMIGKRVLHKAEHGIKATFFLKDRRTFPCHRNKPLLVEITKGGQGPHNVADVAQLIVAHGAINGT